MGNSLEWIFCIFSYKEKMRLLFILRGPWYSIIIQLKLHSGSFDSLSPFLFENLELQLLV